MTGAILVAFVLVALAIGVLLGFLRGLGKARIRGISLLVCAIAAICVALATKEQFASKATEDWLIAFLQSNQMTEVAELFGVSATLREVVLKCAASLVTPLICLVWFIVLSFVTWVIYLVVTLILHGKLRRYNEKASYSRSRAIAWGAVQGLVVIVLALLPISVYAEYVPVVADAAIETGALGENESDLQMVMDDYVDPLNSNFMMTAYRTLGGNALAASMTDFEINDEKVHLSDELHATASIVCNVLQLTEHKLEEYGAKEAAAITMIADSFEDSVLLPTIAGEVIYTATDAWLNGEDFLGVKKPELGADMVELFDPLLTKSLKLLHDDARSLPALKQDIRTLAEMFSILSTSGAFANLSELEKLMENLGDGTVSTLVNVLGKNSSLKALIPEITNLGVRAIATTLGIPSDSAAVYQEMTDNIAAMLNDATLLTGAERITALSSGLVEAFDEAGLSIDREIIDSYSISISEDLIEEANGAALTGNDVQAFFTVYAMNLSENVVLPIDSTDGLADNDSSFDVISALLVGTVYEGKTEEELRQGGAAALAQATAELAKLDGSDVEALKQSAATIFTNAYGDLLAGKEESLEVLAAISVTKPVAMSSVQATAGLQSSNDMKQFSKKVTLDELLIDTDKAAAGINTGNVGKEADAISSIFGAAKDLTSKTSGGTANLNVSEVAGSVGNILDSLHGSESFGSDKTGKLFTAVLQSETVRGAADMDMATATQMAEKATEAGGNYSQTMGAVSSGMEIFNKLGKDDENLTDAEIEALIRDINPQTAGMIEVYITPARIVKYGVPTEYSETSSLLVSTTFSFMAHTTMSEEAYATESAAINNVLKIAISAKTHSSDEALFGGILPSATDTVNSFMASHALSYALRETMLDDNGNVLESRTDAFGLSSRIPAESAEYQECIAAMHNYYAEHPTEENALTMKAICALFGIPVEAIL